MMFWMVFIMSKYSMGIELPIISFSLEMVFQHAQHPQDVPFFAV